MSEKDSAQKDEDTGPAGQKKPVEERVRIDVEQAFITLAQDIYDQISNGSIPKMGVPTRTKQNITFHKRKGVWTYGKSLTWRSAKKLDGASMILRTLYMSEFIDSMIKQSRSSTLREMYYISEGWGLGKFSSQDESNRLAEDLEIITGAMREDFKLRPEEDGARVVGNITLEETNRKGEKKKINCRDDVGDSGYGIPFNVEMDKLRLLDADADFIIAIETGGMFDRLVENGFDEKHRALLLHLKGQPARSTRRFLKRVNEEMGVPVVVFTDGDPWSFRIFASVAYGAIKTAHISEYLATPTAEFIGITASDIVNYDLPTDKLTDQDRGALKAELTDPRFKSRQWHDEIDLMLKLNKKAEQQALAKYGLDYVTATYLPEKLGEMGML
ncbi:MAG: DNA topoisomerase IV subunit A [Candidatus Thermoplasmatota archaeon]|nr:DNA topoisomerase IV subunit A [Candidatus Thermoplasmatota archaeon]